MDWILQYETAVSRSSVEVPICIRKVKVGMERITGKGVRKGYMLEEGERGRHQERKKKNEREEKRMMKRKERIKTWKKRC